MKVLKLLLLLVICATYSVGKKAQANYEANAALQSSLV